MENETTDRVKLIQLFRLFNEAANNYQVVLM